MDHSHVSNLLSPPTPSFPSLSEAVQGLALTHVYGRPFPDPQVLTPDYNLPEGSPARTQRLPMAFSEQQSLTQAPETLGKNKHWETRLH